LILKDASTRLHRRQVEEPPRLADVIYTSNSFDATVKSCLHWKPSELSSPYPSIPVQNSTAQTKETTVDSIQHNLWHW